MLAWRRHGILFNDHSRDVLVVCQWFLPANDDIPVWNETSVSSCFCGLFYGLDFLELRIFDSAEQSVLCQVPVRA